MTNSFKVCQLIGIPGNSNTYRINPIIKVMGKISDTYGRKVVLLASCIATAIGYLGVRIVETEIIPCSKHVLGRFCRKPLDVLTQ